MTFKFDTDTLSKCAKRTAHQRSSVPFVQNTDESLSSLSGLWTYLSLVVLLVCLVVFNIPFLTLVLTLLIIIPILCLAFGLIKLLFNPMVLSSIVVIGVIVGFFLI